MCLWPVMCCSLTRRISPRGAPRRCCSRRDLLDRYKKPAKADLTRLLDAFYPHWERVRRETVSARVGALLNGAG